MTTVSERYNGCPVGYTDNLYPSDDHAPWLKVREIGTHLVSATFLRPRFDRSVGMDQHQVELFLRALHKI